MDKKSEDGSAILRREAEAKLKDWNLPDDVPAEDAKRLIEELRVHQIELEMQNEELRKTRASNGVGPNAVNLTDMCCPASLCG